MLKKLQQRKNLASYLYSSSVLLQFELLLAFIVAVDFVALLVVFDVPFVL